VNTIYTVYIIILLLIVSPVNVTNLTGVCNLHQNKYLYTYSINRQLFNIRYRYADYIRLIIIVNNIKTLFATLKYMLIINK